MLNRSLLSIFVVLLFLTACTNGENQHALFQELGSDQTNITFSNTISYNDSLNVETDSFLYNGAGVAVGDINNDGLPDIFFSGNMVSSRLYLNQGNMRFLDITESAGLETSKRVTGASFVDINSNGYLDIYISVSGYPWSTPDERENLLFINNGDSTFTEAASDYQINDPGFTTHAVFLDFNKSGYLDLFLLGNSPEEFGRGDSGGSFSGATEPNPYGLDQLYRNNGDGTFTNISEEAGILNRLGYGLGVAVSDLNGDGWPDIYVSNDITPNDALYINNRDGTFTDKAADFLQHSSFAGMGIDIADFSNNGWPDILQTDMMPEDLQNRKKMSGSTSNSAFQQLRHQGFFPHYNTNTLQYNHGVNDDGDIIFSEVGRMAGVAYTDWSWSALFADFDNDGYKDIFISNGYPKAVNDFDYLSDMYRARQMNDKNLANQREIEILENLHGYRIPNYVFKNNGDLTFTNKSQQWGLNSSRFSYGAAYADLNNNGRLDLVINNINDKAQIFENIGLEEADPNFLQIKLEGLPPNLSGIGARVILSHDGNKQFIYHSPFRGYMSTMDNRIHFGLGSVMSGQIDSLEVIWPDDSYQLMTDIEVNQLLTIQQLNADRNADSVQLNEKEQTKVFASVQNNFGLDYIHNESGSMDFNIQPLLPYEMSKQHIALAVGDVTGNGLDDVYIGGAADISGKLYIQQHNGEFTESTQMQPWDVDIRYDDWDAEFFDANGNGLLDLYVSSGSFRLSTVSELLQDRLYINNGNGQFIKDDNALPEMLISSGVVKAGDFTGDGLMDLFVGGSLSPRQYPFPARSFILKNEGGRFTDVTDQIAPALKEPGGMITDAVWTDFDGDGQLDLITTGKWMPVQFFKNDGEYFSDITESLTLPPMRGWWFSIEAGDFNNNGFIDLIAGNLGLNFSFTTSEESKFGVYAYDFNDNWIVEPVLVQEMDGEEYPYFGLAKLGGVIDQVGYRYNRFDEFSKASVRQIFDRSNLDEALHYQADTFASMHLQNNGDGTFAVSNLPNMAQISPVNDLIAHDFDADGNLDLLLVGNLFKTDPNIPRADAGKGLFLRGNGRGNLEPIPPLDSGFIAPNDAKKMALINTPEGKAVLVINRNDSLQVFRLIYNE